MFRLSQSTNIFEDYKVKLINLLDKHVNDATLNECLNRFEKLEKKHSDLYDEIKSK